MTCFGHDLKTAIPDRGMERKKRGLEEKKKKKLSGGSDLPDSYFLVKTPGWAER